MKLQGQNLQISGAREVALLQYLLDNPYFRPRGLSPRKPERCLTLDQLTQHIQNVIARSQVGAVEVKPKPKAKKVKKPPVETKPEFVAKLQNKPWLRPGQLKPLPAQHDAALHREQMRVDAALHREEVRVARAGKAREE